MLTLLITYQSFATILQNITSVQIIDAWNNKKQGRIVHRSGKENKIIYKINKGEKGLIDRWIQIDYIQIDRPYR